jgi:hypothetical protein
MPATANDSAIAAIGRIRGARRYGMAVAFSEGNEEADKQAGKVSRRITP